MSHSRSSSLVEKPFGLSLSKPAHATLAAPGPSTGSGRTVFCRLNLATAALLMLLAPASHAQQALACLITPDEVVEVGSPVVGVLENVDVLRGQIVTKGQVMARLSSNVERANRNVASQRLKAEGELQAAMANQEFLKKRAERSASLVKQEFISPQAHDQVANESKLADRKVASTKESRAVMERELELAEAQLAQRAIKSPISGVIVERYMNAGERVEEKPIVKVAAIDPLRVEVVVPSAHFFKIKPGMTAMVTPELAGLGPMAATVQSMDRVVDAASNSFRVRLALPNPKHEIPAGLRCKIAMAFDPSAPVAPPPAPATPAGERPQQVGGLKMSPSLGAVMRGKSM